MNLALYREFRPKTFEEVIGQSHITRTLQNQIKNGTTTHAYLFTGPRGTGKTSVSKIFSRAVNCENPQNGSPCGKCSTCQALKDVNTDILEIDAASNNRVDEIRDLRERVKYPPVIGKKKVYIIDEVHMLTDSAFNALLKTLEEPPEYVVFILATTEVHKIPATILSRCTRFDFRLFSIEELVAQLRQVLTCRKVSFDEESLYVIARQGEGSSRDTLSIADSVMSYSENEITIQKTLEVLGLSSTTTITNIIDNIANNDVAGLFKNVNTALANGKNITVLCKEVTECFKNLLLINQNVTDVAILNILPTDIDDYKKLSKRLTVSTMKLAFEKFSKIELDLKFSLNPQNLFESVCVSLMQNAEDNTIQNTKQTTNVNNKEQSIDKVSIEKIQNVAKQEEEYEIPTLNINNIGKIWGEVLINIKNKNMFALTANLKNIYNVGLNGNKLVLHTNEKSVFETVDSEDKKIVILNVLKEMNILDIKSIQVIYDEDNKNDKDITKSLEKIFLDKIKIK